MLDTGSDSKREPDGRSSTSSTLGCSTSEACVPCNRDRLPEWKEVEELNDERGARSSVPGVRQARALTYGGEQRR